jgi:hypothetical protein
VTSCADVRRELVAVLRGEAAESVAAAVARHVRECPACDAERESLARTLDVVSRHVHPETSADARLRLREALDRELSAPRAPRPARPRLGLFAVPAAMAAGALVALAAAGLGTDVRRRPAGGEVARTDRAPATHGELETKSADAMARGLQWLAAQQADDGTWGPGERDGTETVEAATAASLLAFAGGGETAYRGPRAEALARADARLAEILAEPPSGDAERKPVYSLALGVRALATTYALDRDDMDPDARRRRRELLTDAGRRLVQWQRDDGGFGYVPAAVRSDSSCTVFALAALVDLRRAGLLDASGAVARGLGYLDGLRGTDGALSYSRPGDRAGTPALSAALLALDHARGASREPTPGTLERVERAVAAGGDALLAWTGTEALVAHGRPVEAPVRGLLAAQRADGAWSAAADERCRSAGDSVTTAFGVLALSAVCAR